MYILLTGIIINAITVTNSMSCDKDWLEYQGKCLKHYNTALSWSGAYSTCVGLRNALLATVHSPETKIFVQNNVTRGSDSWIGLRIPDISKSSWKWSDGNDTSSYDDWTATDVISACAVMKYDNTKGYWYTAPCTDMKYYICEKEMFADNCSDWLNFETHCYLNLHKLAQTNMAAARNCWEFDAYLVSINSQPEADFIYSNIDMNKEYWIGLSPLKWVNDVPYQWNNWGDGGPTHDIENGCVYIKSSSGKWFCENCENTKLQNRHHSYICQKDANNDTMPSTVYSQTSKLPEEINTTRPTSDSASTVQGETDTDKQQQLLLPVVVPAVCGGAVAIIVIIIIVIVTRRKRRSNTRKKANQSQINTPFDIKTTAVNGTGTVDCQEHRQNGKTIHSQDHENYIYDEAEVVQAEKGTIVVNGDVYAIVDKEKGAISKVQDQMGSQQHAGVSPIINQKQEIIQEQNHIIVGADVYAIVNKSNVKLDTQSKPKQKKKKPPPPPKLVDKSEEIKSNRPSHKVVGTDVYAVVNKEKVKPNKQQTPKEQKKKPTAPPKLVENADAMNEESVYYNESTMNTLPVNPAKHKGKGTQKTENTGVVYADLDLTGSGSGNGQDGINYEQSGVVYADVRS